MVFAIESNVAANSVCARIFNEPVTLSAAKPACVKLRAAKISSLDETPNELDTLPTSVAKPLS